MTPPGETPVARPGGPDPSNSDDAPQAGRAGGLLKYADGEGGVSQVSHAAAAQIDAEAGRGGAQTDVRPPMPRVSGLEQFDDLDAGLDEVEVHGTAVALGGRAALFVGRSGSGKSAMALDMIAAGAELVADDRVLIRAEGDQRLVAARFGFEGLIEARGVGILKLPHAAEGALAVIVDMERTELHRLPPPRTHKILRKPVHLVYGRENWSLGPALLALLAGALVLPNDP